MSRRYLGGFITANPTIPTASSASGAWTLSQQNQYASTWPIYIDPLFEYVTLLLNGDGTNGGQNNTFLDSSTNNFTITRNGNTTQGSFSPYGTLWSNIFTTTTSRVTYGSESNWAFLSNGASDWTIDGWIFYSANDGDIVNTSGGSAQVGMQLYFGSPSSGLLTVYFTNGGGATGGSSTSAMTANQWNYFAVTFTSSTKVIAYYINGVAAGTNSHSGFSFSGSNPNFAARIGNSLFGSQGGGTNTMLSNIRISNTVRTGLTTVPTSPFSSDGNTSLLVCNSNGFADKSSNNYSVSVNSVPSVQRFSPFEPSAPYSTSVIGGSGYFDGSGDNLSIANNSNLQTGTGAFTYEFWIKGGTGGTIFRKGGYGTPTGSGLDGVELYTDGAGTNLKLLLGCGTSGSTTPGAGYDVIEYTGTESWSNNAWHHIAIVRSGNSFQLFLDGVSKGNTASSAWDMNNTEALTLMGRDSDSYVQGTMANFRFTKGAALYTAGFTPPTTPLTTTVSSGTVQFLANFTNASIFDYAMQNNLETAGNAQISTSVVKYGSGSLSFDGTGDYLRTPATNYITPLAGNFTIECWIYFNSVATQQTILGTWESPTFWELAYINGSGLRFYPNNSTNISIGGVLSTGTWYHVAVVRSGSTITTYLDGTSQSSATFTSSIGSTSRAVGIGSEAPWTGFYFNGYLDDIRITNGVARYTANFTPPTGPFYTY